ncbi:C2 domain-containing protein 5 [Camelus dromedarius]|uniref:C2 domain-containing protein 5 n=1 Tax=Camelus dromedarius TaxID=9838 RepID=A0A5N4C661_CAMDR|nr:C2 domain-containing protein 5 [Camelus dromedarius]
MPGKLKVKIVAGRHLPVMDRASDLTDAFVEVKFGNTTFKTDVCLKSLNPQWNSEWFKFEVDDEDLQDEPLQITVLDHDTYSANDAIGKVYIDIDPLLYSEAATVISGWFPIYDTIHGIRGEINVVVKVDLFNDLNRFRQSSCGVKFFCTTSIPKCYRAVIIHGFVEELVVNEDPEYQWIDRIRTPRASNEARQRLISLMSGELQRKIGLKVLEMRGNAVVGYLQCFDLEGESGLVVRAIGTACTLDKLSSPAAFLPACNSPSKEMKEIPFNEDPNPNTHSSGPSTPLKNQTYSFSPSKSYSRQSSSSDTDLSLTPKTGMGSGSAGKEGGPFKALLRQQTQSALEQREFPFFTLTAFPPGFLVHVGGVVSARSVKLLDRIHNPDEPETRDAWWAEIRQEIKSHAKALGCHAVVGYSESTSIWMLFFFLPYLYRLEENLPAGCGFCHIPYDELNMPFPAHLTHCYNCRKQKVPDVLFTTIDLPVDATVIGKGCLIQARLCRLKKKAQAEANATAISNLLPFMEYEVHTQLMNKLKLKGMNALFGLRIQISVGENMLMGLASATGVYLAALPTPGGIQIAGKTPNDGSYEQHISHMQKKINDTIAKNKELYEINPPEMSEEIIGSPIPEPRQRSRLLRSQSESSDEVAELDLSHGKKDAFVLEVLFTINYNYYLLYMLCYYNYNGILQMFTSVRVIRLSSLNLTNQALNKNFNDLCENLLKVRIFLLTVTVTAVAITFDKNQALQTAKTHAEKSLQRVFFLPLKPLQIMKNSCSFHWSSAQTHSLLILFHRLKVGQNTWRVQVLTQVYQLHREEGGVSGFLHAFIAEVFAMVRAHVAALGGNAVVSYIMKQCVFMENPNKNQAQCLINVSGDAVVFVRESELEVVSTQQPTANCQPACAGGEVTT